MKIGIITLGLLLLIQTAGIQGQTNKLSVKNDTALRLTIKNQAAPLGKAFLAGDFDKILELMHPAARKKIPNEKEFLENTRSMLKQAADAGIKTISFDVEEPKEIVPVGKQLFAVVPVKIRMQTPKGIFVQYSFEIAVSDNSGKIWKFVGVGASLRNGKESLKELFPAAADKLELPKVNLPVIEQS